MGWQAMAYYMSTTVLAAITGIICVLAIHPGKSLRIKLDPLCLIPQRISSASWPFIQANHSVFLSTTLLHVGAITSIIHVLVLLNIIVLAAILRTSYVPAIYSGKS